MPNYRELEIMVGNFVELRGNTLLLPTDAAKTMRGLQGLVEDRLESDGYCLYMVEVYRFLKPGRVSDFMKAHLSYRLGREFATGWYSEGELIRENGILLSDFGIDMQSRSSRGRFRFFSTRYAPDIERAYFSKYGEQIEVYNRIGIPQVVDLEAWAQHLG